MRYRIQTEPMLGCTIVVVSQLDSYGGRTTATTKLYTLEGEIGAHGGLVEVLGELQRLIAESAP